MINFDFNDRSVLVTGGTGSFGQAFIRKLLADHNPRRIVVFSRDEAKQADMAQRIPQAEFPALRYFIGDVRDPERLEMAMRGIDTVVHAAALKHVPAAEYNPFECIRTNVQGAENIVRAALRAGIERVLALSTDKAANPVNLYGASKLAADKIFVAANNLSGGTTRFSIVRYGNVIGSRGSVVVLYRRLIEQGARSLPVTDQRMTRFWITLPQGVDFVLSCLPRMQGGEIFVPRIPSMRIVDVARAMAPDLPQEVVGIRPGEKLHEVMITEDDARTTIELPDRYVILPAIAFWNDTSFKEHGGNQAPENFRYASDTNDRWLSVAEFKSMVDDKSS